MQEVLGRPQIIGQEVARLRRDDPTALDRSSVQRRLAEIARERTRLVRLAAKTDDEHVADGLQTDISALDIERSRLAAERASWEADQQRLDDLESWSGDVSRNLSLLDDTGRCLTLEALGVQVRVWATSHDPRYEIRMELDAGTAITGSTVNGLQTATDGDHAAAHVDGCTRRGCARRGARPAGRP